MKKKKLSNVMTLTTDELISKVVYPKASRKLVLPCIVLVCFVAAGLISYSSLCKERSIGGEGLISMMNSTAATANTKKDLIAIPTGIVKANPFLPYRNIGDGSSAGTNVPAFELIAPPEEISEGSEAARVMDTIVSGILYDKYSPSAILNIEGNDYLVKKGDTVNNYKVLDITRDSVTVKLGANTYKAGIGEILTEGTITVNDVSNLSKKFGGERK